MAAGAALRKYLQPACLAPERLRPHNVRGRGQEAPEDYVLYYKPNMPIAIIEAKDNTGIVGDGMQQALGYAETLKIPFVFSSNGDGFVFHDVTGQSAEKEATLTLDQFPSPDALWAKYRAWKGLAPEAEAIVLQDYHDDGSGKEPRYYQRNAVNAAVETIAKGQNRVLLVMATGTGKTYTAFQIIWRRIDTSYEIYLGLYQAITGRRRFQYLPAPGAPLSSY